MSYLSPVAYLPHDAPMMLLESVENVTDDMAVCRVAIDRQSRDRKREERKKEKRERRGMKDRQTGNKQHKNKNTNEFYSKKLSQLSRPKIKN